MSAKKKLGRRVKVPLSVSSPALLVGGSDLAFRGLISNLHAMASQLIELRARMARQLGITGPQFGLFLAVAHFGNEGGVNVSTIARQLRVTPAFVTTEAGKLIRRRILAKRDSKVDRRGVLLSVTPSGHRMLAAFAPRLQTINDEVFRSIDARSFRTLTRMVEGLVAGAERALSLDGKK
ncbi:MAG: MarR family winged helix-turn-helix transcriptional regulator [Alphaproteobacteria bacterium]